MKFTFVLAFTLLLCRRGNAQDRSDTLSPELAAKITVAGVCLCRTTLSDLRQSNQDLSEVKVEEMDVGKRCTLSTDSRYTNGKGYYSLELLQ